MQTDVKFLTAYAAAAGNADEKLRVLNEAQGAASDAMIEYATSEKMAAEGVDGFINQQIAARQSTLKFGDALKAVGKKLGMMGANMAAMFIVTKVIQFTTSAVMDYIHRVEIAKKKVEESVSAYEQLDTELENISSELETQSKRMDELLAKDKLTYAEQGELEELKEITKELRVQQALKEKEKESGARQVIRDTMNAFNKEFGDKTVSSAEVDDYLTNVQLSGGATAALIADKSNISALIAAYKALTDMKNQSAQSDEEEFQIFSENAQKVEDLIYKQLSSLQAYKEALSALPFEELTTEQQKTFLLISENLKNAWSMMDPAQWNEWQIQDIFNSPEIEKSKNELIELVQAGELTEKTIRNFPKLFAAIANADLVIEDENITNTQLFLHELKALGREIEEMREQELKIPFIDAFKALPMEEIEEFMALFKDGLIDEASISSYEKLAAIMGETGISATDAVAALEEFSKSFTSSIDLTSNIQDAYDLLEKVRKEVKETSLVSLESLTSIADKFPELSSATAEYAQGLISTADLMKLLDQAYVDDANSFRVAMAAKLEGNETFFNTIRLNNQGLFESLAKAYDVDVSNWKTMAQAKAEIDQALIRNLGKAWGQYYSVTIDQATGLASLVSNAPTTGLTAEQDVELIVARIKAESMVSSFNHAKEAMDKAAQITVDIPDFGGIGGSDSKSGGGSGGDSDSSSEKEIDWIERRLQLLEEKRSQLEAKSTSPLLSYLGLDDGSVEEALALFEKLNNGIGLSSEEFGTLNAMASKAGMSMTEFYDMLRDGGSESRKSYLSALLETDTTLLGEYSKAADSYRAAYEKSVEGLSDEIRQKIEAGGSDIASYSGDEGEQIQTAIDARDKYLEAMHKEEDQKAQLVDTTKRYYENEVAYLDAQSSRIEHRNSMLNAQIDYLTTSGQVVNASIYESLIANLRREEEIINQKLRQRKTELKALMASGDVKEGSEEYYTLTGYIEECESSLIDLSTQQEEYNNKLLQLPIDNMDTLISMYNELTNAMTNWGAEIEASGRKLDAEYYQMLINNGMTLIDQYREQAELIRDVMDEYEVGSENWNTLYSRLQSINAEMSSMVQNLHKWNEALLQMPLDSVSEFSSNLQKALDAMSSLQGDYDTVINAVTGAIQEQIDALNEEKELINEQKNAQIEVLQERLELLRQQNEALNLQTALEQALYNLQTANTQKTEKVIRDGEFVHETNADNIRKAQEEVQDALSALEEYKLSQEIEALEKELDAINKKYEDQIEQLEKISEKWSEIASKIEQAKNESLADEYLGEGWKDKAFSGNDADIFNMFKGMYQTLSDQMTQYEEQINSTENIYALLQEYIQAYKAGTITYDQAAAGINDLLSQMNQKMSAMDNLQNVLDYLGTAADSDATIPGVLEGIQSSLTETAEELLKSFKTYNDNAGLISEYTTSWQQLTNNVEDIRDLIEDVRDSLEDVIYDVRNRDDEDDEDDDDGWHSSGPTVGPGGTAGSHVIAGGDYVNSGPGVMIVEEKHKGIDSGLIGKSDKSREAILQEIASDQLKPGETYLKALEGEAVFTEEQQKNLIRNLQAAGYGYPTTQIRKQNLAAFQSQGRNVDVKVDIGNISLPSVRDVDGFAKAMRDTFATKLRQEASKMRW